LFVSGAIGGPERGWESHCRNGGRTTWAQSKKHPQPDWLRVSVQLSKCDGLVHTAHARLRVIAEYSLLGGGIWNMMRPFSQLWLLLDGLFELS
jgi:hypothetical protein